MRNNKNGLDEMQRERRNNIGNQMFILMFYALMIDFGLYGYGIRWLNYPANVMAIITVCMIIYLLRVIAFDAYLPPKAQNRTSISVLCMAIVFSIVIVIIATNFFRQSPERLARQPQDNSAAILMIISAVGLISTLIVAAIKKVNNNKGDKDE